MCGLIDTCSLLPKPLRDQVNAISVGLHVTGLIGLFFSVF